MRETVHGLGALLLLSGCYGILWMGLQGYHALQSEMRHHGGSVQSSSSSASGQAFSAQALPIPPPPPDYRLAHQKLPFVIRP